MIARILSLSWKGAALLYPLWLLGCGGGEKRPDRPRRWPDGGFSPDGGLPGEPDLGVSTDAEVSDGGGDAEAECLPEVCDGVIDLARAEGESAPCLSFADPETIGETASPYIRLSSYDLNGDGWKDLIAARDAASAEVYFRTPGGFTPSTLTGIDLSEAEELVPGDYDSDGDADLFVTRASGNGLYRNDAGVYTLLAEPAGINGVSAGGRAVWLGSHLLHCNENGTAFYRDDGDGFFTDATSSAGLSDPGDCSRMAVADYDGDGLDDVYLANLTGARLGMPNRLFHNLGDVDLDGAPNFESVEGPLGVMGSEGSTDAEWVRFDASGGLLGIYVAVFGGANFLYVTSGAGSFWDLAPSLGVQDSGQSTVATWGVAGSAVDDLNPWLFIGRWEQGDLLFTSILGSEGEVTGYEERSTPLGLGGVTSTIGAVWVHADEDGAIDLVRATTTTLTLYRNLTALVTICPEDDK